MSKITTAAATSHALSLAAMEEASRVGARTADIDHLLIALVLNAQAAGQVLRSFGATFENTRAAVVEQHSDQLASLGIQTHVSGPGKIVFHETDGYEWSDRALEVIRRAGTRGRRGDASAVLRELLAEPSGLIDAILQRFNISAEDLKAKLDETERYVVGLQPRAARTDALSGTSKAFVPAPPEEVWKLLADPTRMPEWEPSTEGVEATADAPAVGDTWKAFPPIKRPGGKPLRVKPGFEMQHVELVRIEKQRLIEWRRTWPGAPRANAPRVTAALEPAAGGTNLQLALAWERNPNRRQHPILSWLFRPAYRFTIWMQLSQLGSGIGRVFR